MLRIMLIFNTANADKPYYNKDKGDLIMAKDNCEMCVHYVFDYYTQCYCCEINLDEDEMEKFLRGNNYDCHYFEMDDEYKIVRKQN